MQIPDNHYSYNQKETFKGREVETELIFKWFKIEKLGEIVLYPSFLKDKLRDIKSYPENIIYRDD